MPKATYTAEAERDLDAIVDFIAMDSASAAKSWLSDVRSRCDLLAFHPAIGERLAKKRLHKVRRHVVGNYLIYYEATPQGIDVLRIVHGARDQEGLL